MSEAPTSAPRRVRKRIWIPLVLLVVLLGAFVVLYVRGTWADDIEKNPATAAEGTQTQLWRDKEGEIWVRCAIIVDAPAKQVWSVVSDHGEHARYLPYVSEVSAQKMEDGRILIKGVAHSRLWGDWPYESRVTHEKVEGKGYIAHWDEKAEGALGLNRGRWEVRELEPGKTLLVFSLQAEAEGYPSFLIRNILMDRMHAVVKAMREQALKHTGS